MIYYKNSGCGRMKNPETDRRLKRNRQNVEGATPVRRDVMHNAQGRVKDPTKDRRLKINRDKPQED